MGYFTKTTASVVNKLGSSIRNKVNINRRAKLVKHFIIKKETTEEDLISEQERATAQTNNKKKIQFGFEEQSLLLALTKKRTAVRFGYTHYCNLHNTLVYAQNIDKCECIKPKHYRVTEIIALLAERISVSDNGLYQISSFVIGIWNAKFYSLKGMISLS